MWISQWREHLWKCMNTFLTFSHNVKSWESKFHNFSHFFTHFSHIVKSCEFTYVLIFPANFMVTFILGHSIQLHWRTKCRFCEHFWTFSSLFDTIVKSWESKFHTFSHIFTHCEKLWIHIFYHLVKSCEFMGNVNSNVNSQMFSFKFTMLGFKGYVLYTGLCRLNIIDLPYFQSYFYWIPLISMFLFLLPKVRVLEIILKGRGVVLQFFPRSIHHPDRTSPQMPPTHGHIYTTRTV